jgi:CcmD family protein
MLAAIHLLIALALQPSPGQSEFVPVTGPVTEHLPAAPLLIAAYAFVWIAVMVYVWTIWRRLKRVEADLQELERRQRRSSAPTPR